MERVSMPRVYVLTRHDAVKAYAPHVPSERSVEAGCVGQDPLRL